MIWYNMICIVLCWKYTFPYFEDVLARSAAVESASEWGDNGCGDDWSDPSIHPSIQRDQPDQLCCSAVLLFCCQWFQFAAFSTTRTRERTRERSVAAIAAITAIVITAALFLALPPLCQPDRRLRHRHPPPRLTGHPTGQPAIQQPAETLFVSTR